MKSVCDNCLLEHCSYEPHSEECQSTRLFKEKIGIFGGTFSPMTKAHLDIINKSLDIVDVLYIVPTADSYRRKITVPTFFSFLQRCEIIEEMLKLLPEDKRSRVFIDDVEQVEACSHRTIDTVRYFKEEFSDDELYLIVGADTFNKIGVWNEHEKLLEMTKLIVAEGRNGEELKHDFEHITIFTEDEHRTVSASQIRSDLIEKMMYDYIEKVNKCIIK